MQANKFSRAVCIGGMSLMAMSARELPAQNIDDASQAKLQVMAAERAFARSMAERDFDAFQRFLSEEAVFFGSKQVWHGRTQVAQAWKAYFEGPQAPFSWEPETVEVLPSGTLAHSSGPVRDASGNIIMHFNSVWRREAPGVWRVVFDKGSPLPTAAK